jgi:hypothetical protein
MSNVRAARPSKSGSWTLNLYAEAGEGGGCYVPSVKPEPTGRGSDPARAELEAVRRARGKVRRYAATHRLNRFVTLTYAGEGCFDPRELRRHVGEFFKGLRRELGGKAFPYVCVPEWHPGGHGLHVHFAVGRYVRQGQIRDVWGRGIVHVKLIGDLPVGSGALEESRVSARYLAKYMSKNVGEGRVPGLHRYEVAQGFQPQPILVYGESADDVIGRASEYMQRPPARVWRSWDEPDWRRSPAYWCEWAS